MDYSLNECPWEPIHGFHSPSEFQKFEKWITGQIQERQAEELPVEVEFQGNYGPQRWFKHVSSGQIWYLAPPDAPFYGVFEPLVSRLLERLCYLLGQAGQERWESVINEAAFALREPDFPKGYQKVRSLYQSLVKTENGFADLKIKTPADRQLQALRNKITLLFN
ncbi:MAG: hypothetical protein HYV14_03215 [Elusimicrobia bacterium]|nr:hypothetical protein [Elusimicrobiota bacterium]